MAFLDAHPGLGYPAAAGLGLLVGSFLNVVILRLPNRLEWQWKRDAHEILEQPEIYDPPPPGIVVEGSHCPNCKKPLSWYENIPLFSWIIQGGKCRGCKAPISIQYPLVELLTGLLFLACVWRFGFGWQGFGALVLTSFLIAASDNLYIPAKPALLGAMAGYLSLWSVYWVFKQLTGKEGMGHGDFKLLAALGAWMGLSGILPTIMISSLVGAIVGSIWLAVKGRDKATPIPFGPYLAVAGWISFMWGQQLVDAYLRFAGLA